MSGYSAAPDPRFDAWKEKAFQADILTMAKELGAKLKRAGSYWVGPCPTCGGTDRFSVNPGRRTFNCRPVGGGNVVTMVRHIERLSFLEACEKINGEPPPGRKSTPLTEEEKAEIERRRRRAAAEQEKRDKAAARKLAGKIETAGTIWRNTIPLTGTIAERYLIRRGLRIPPCGWPDCLGFHPNLEWTLGRVYEDGPMGRELVKQGPFFPALVCRVDAADGTPCGVWRIYLDADGNKAPVDNPKVGLGQGGAIRIGGGDAHIGAAEGAETALAAWEMTDYRKPVWALQSTSGMIGFDPPAFIKSVMIFPDGDIAHEDKRTGKLIVPGAVAAEKLHERCRAIGLPSEIGPTPEPLLDGHDKENADYLNILHYSAPARR